MPAKIHRIKLSEDERLELESVRRGKRCKPADAAHAMALLMCDEGPRGPALTDAEITRGTGLSARTLERLRKRCCEVGPIGSLQRKERDKPPREIKITGDVQARIIQLACSQPPAGHSRWTLRLLADHLVEIEVIESISHQSVATVLKKTNSSLGGRNVGASRQRKTPPS